MEGGRPAVSEQVMGKRVCNANVVPEPGFGSAAIARPSHGVVVPQGCSIFVS